LFLYSTVFLCVLVLGTCIWELAVSAKDSSSSSPAIWMSILLIMFSMVIACCVGSLCFFHTQIAGIDTTTRQHIKRDRPSPAPDTWSCSACWNVVCGPAEKAFFPRKLVSNVKSRGRLHFPIGHSEHHTIGETHALLRDGGTVDTHDEPKHGEV
jgi:hypothetical protein